MKPIIILYATRTGQTAKIAERIAGDLGKRGLAAELKNVKSSPQIELGGYAAAILAAPVYYGRYRREMAQFIQGHLAQLNRMPTAFLSVMLSQAGVETLSTTETQRQAAAAEVSRIMDELFQKTGWRPTHSKPVAGALVYSQYNLLIRFIMKRIARSVGAGTDTSRDYEYTDWAGLDQFADQMAAEFATACIAT